MTRHEILADALRGSYWFDTAAQGDAYQTWEEIDPKWQDFWLSVSRRFENRIERQGYIITKAFYL